MSSNNRLTPPCLDKTLYSMCAQSRKGKGVAKSNQTGGGEEGEVIDHKRYSNLDKSLDNPYNPKSTWSG